MPQRICVRGSINVDGKRESPLVASVLMLVHLTYGLLIMNDSFCIMICPEKLQNSLKSTSTSAPSTAST